MGIKGDILNDGWCNGKIFALKMFSVMIEFETLACPVTGYNDVMGSHKAAIAAEARPTILSNQVDRSQRLVN